MGKVQNGETSYRETILGILPRRKVIQLEIAGTKRGLLLLKNIARKQEKLTIPLIKKVHRYCFHEILPKNAGKFRTAQVTYSEKEAPHFSRLHELMKNLCEDTEYMLQQLPQKDTDAFLVQCIEMLARFQHRFVLIHPFIDYNGRMARMLTNYLLMRLTLPIIEIHVASQSERKQYILALQNADGGNYHLLEHLLAQALNESLQKIQ